MARLCLINDDGAVVESWELNGKPITVGRGQAVDVKIHDEGLSRRHFMVTREDEQYILKDLSSRNGTWVDGERAFVVQLKHNDPILAGRTEFRFCERPAVPDLSF